MATNRAIITPACTSENIYSYGINARGRMTTVSLGGTEIAAYSYDESEQRIIKTAANQTTHYHYDLEGRLIAETDGTTGETLREYVWLGLMPIAVIAPTESTPEGECNPTLIEALEAELTASTAAATALQDQILDWDGNIAFREAKIAEMREQLDGLSGKQREKLEDKIAKWESLISSTTAKVTEAEAELATVNATIADIQTSLAEQQAICEGTPTGTEAGTFYLHADHLGRPQFATDTDGAVVWDMGEGVTPFGQGVNLAGAFAQRLMFPGQYADEETGEDVTLSHNWHRTYDPTIGRYLQSDPIGLAGGLNRYAYVGGNPVKNIDSNGLYFSQGEFSENGYSRNGYMPDSVNLAANLAQAASMRNKNICSKLIWFYNMVNYGKDWDYKTNFQSNRRYSYNYSRDFENFGNWHYGVMGAAAGISPSMLVNMAGAAQYKRGLTQGVKTGDWDYYTANWGYMKENLGCPDDAEICFLISSPLHFDDPNDQYWIKKGISDFNSGNVGVLRGRDYSSDTGLGLRGIQ